jgi:UDPglucose 6-dehydrogenase
VIEVNELQKRRVDRKLQKHLGSLVDKEIALLGWRSSRHRRRARGDRARAGRAAAGEGATCAIYDPCAERTRASMLGRRQLVRSAEEALDGADARCS